MKKAIRKVLNYLGYDIVKVVPTPTPFLKKEVQVKVGNFELTLPTSNPLIITYTEQKDFATEISRLVNYVYDKYADLTFLDVGANTGDTVAVVKSAKDVPVISIEGDEFSYSYLKRNTAQFSNVTIFNNFLGEKKGAIEADLQKKGWNTTIVPGKGNGNKIDMITLDDLLTTNFPNNVVSQIKLLKIDTEGFDTIIIRGALNYIQAIKPVIYFEYNRDNMQAINEDGLATIRSLESLGYKTILFFDDRGRFILSTDMADKETIQHLNDYADGKNGLIYYYNICLFHKEDTDIAVKTIAAENRFREQLAKASY
jgi:FkbM family methyltransferase